VPALEVPPQAKAVPTPENASAVQYPPGPKCNPTFCNPTLGQYCPGHIPCPTDPASCGTGEPNTCLCPCPGASALEVPPQAKAVPTPESASVVQVPALEVPPQAKAVPTPENASAVQYPPGPKCNPTFCNPTLGQYCPGHIPCPTDPASCGTGEPDTCLCPCPGAAALEVPPQAKAAPTPENASAVQVPSGPACNPTFCSFGDVCPGDIPCPTALGTAKCPCPS